MQTGMSAEVEVPEGATRVSLAGKTVMPGIIDTHTHLRSDMRETLIEDLQRRAYYGVVATMSLGRDTGDVPYQIREAIVPNASRFRTAGLGITVPEPGRSELPYWVTNEAEAREAVQEQAQLNVDLIKIWVDDWNGKYVKLTPELYGAIIDEAHQNGLRVTAHLFDLEDAKGLLRAGVDAFAHSVRDLDMDEELAALFEERPDVVLVPNLPDPGVAADLSWMSDTVPADELQKLQAAATDRPEAQKLFGIQARNLVKLSAAGVRIALGTDGQQAVWGAPRDGGHGGGGDVAAAGHCRGDSQFGRSAGHYRPRHGGGGQERGLRGARRESAGRHHEHPAHQCRLHARDQRRPHRSARSLGR